MTQRVLIVGGGFGGLYAAKALSRAPVEVTLVDRSHHHLFQPRLYQVMAGALPEREIAVPLCDVLRRQANARVLQAEVDGFDLDARTVSATAPGGDPLTLGYDRLIVAAGVSGGLKTLDDARAVRSRVTHAVEQAERTRDLDWLRFAVVGGGQTGIELAGAIAELVGARKARISLVEAGPRLLPDFPEPLRLRAARELAELGVDVWLRARVLAVDDDGLEIAGALRMPARTVLWAAGVKASPLARALADATGADVDNLGRIVVNDDLTVPGHPEVFAIGDMAAVEGVPGIAAAAMQQGRHAARAIAGRPFRYADRGALTRIGRRRALGTAFGIRVAGPPARLARALHLVPLTDLSKTARTTARVTI
jgi:NADH dehydrogenase